MMDDLWGEPEIIDPKAKSEKKKAKAIKQSIEKPKKVKTVVQKVANKQATFAEQLELIKPEVYRILGKHVPNVICIKDFDTYIDYIKKAIASGYCAIDTETNNSLDPITCKIAGLCLYYPGGKYAYVPVNHIDAETGIRLDWQLTEEQIRVGLELLNNSETFLEYHNAKFDYQVIKCTCKIDMRIDWDSFIGSKLLDENRYEHNLKHLFTIWIDNAQEEYHIDTLFENVDYLKVPPELMSIYAATDSYETHEVCQYELTLFNLPENVGIYNLAKELEMPCIQVLAEMELNGMYVDQEYAKRLSESSHKKLDDADAELNKILTDLLPTINEWKTTTDALDKQMKKQSEKQRANALASVNYDDSLWKYSNGNWYKVSKCRLEQIDETLTAESLSSPTQLSILLYHILKCPIVNEEKPDATGEEELKSIKKYGEKTNNTDIIKLIDLILTRRELVKLLSTYIDNIPEIAKQWPDGRVRTHFNQYGADTGRLSSSKPVNFQNIPSHNKAIRLLFRAREGYRIVGGDFSAQEPRIVAHFSGDKNMLDAYLQNRDLYSVIASQSFNVPYEDCLEFYPEGTKIIFEGKETITGYKTHQNKAGKERRTQAKSILLGILYGRGAASVGEQIGKTKEEAQEILDKFFNAFPKVKEWIQASQDGCRESGYVEDVGGRRRRLPDIKLPQFTVKYKDENNSSADFNPFIGCGNRSGCDELLNSYRERAVKAKYKKAYDALKAEADSNGILISNNQGFIAQAERQCVNARVQGSAATLTKNALLSIYNDPRMKEIGAYLVNTVHDEILIEVPVEYSERAEELLVENMIGSAKKYVPVVPMKTDTYNVDMWYADEYQVLLETEYKHLIEGDPKKGIEPIDADTAQQMVIDNHLELLPSQVIEAIHTGELHLNY